MKARVGIGFAIAGMALALLAWFLSAPDGSQPAPFGGGIGAMGGLDEGDPFTPKSALAIPADAPAARDERGPQLRVTGPGGEALPGAELQFAQLPGFEVQFDGAVATLQLDPDRVLPEGLLSAWAAGHCPRARYVAAGTTWRELTEAAVALEELWFMPVVASAGRRHTLWLQEAMAREGRAKLDGLSTDWAALGQADLANQVALAPDEYVFLQTWMSHEPWQDRRAVVEFRGDSQRPVLYDVLLSRAGEESVDPVVYRMPTKPEQPSDFGWLQLRFHSGHPAGWCTETNRPQVVMFDVLRDVPDREDPEHTIAFAVWHPGLGCYRARLPLGPLRMRTSSRAYPMPLDRAVPLPIVGTVQLSVREQGDPLHETELVYLEQDARVVDVPEQLGVSAPPGTRWLLHRDPSARLRMGKGRLGSFTAVLAPGTWHFAWDLGRRGELPDSVPSRMAVEVRVEG